mmetsp:Transcript_73475/g.175234  ORF Transcript_73475/g.175234 Transcript_73475/m.175234 type:complete len:257 (+) Transcript_73475:470-1240(+)
MYAFGSSHPLDAHLLVCLGFSPSLLSLQALHIPRIAPVEQGVGQQSDEPRDANGGRHGRPQRPGRGQGLTLHLLGPEAVAEGHGQGRHQAGADGVGQGVLHGALPGHHLAAVAGRHDVRQDGEVGAGLGPGPQQPEARDQRKVGAEGARPRGDPVKLQEDHGDADGHGDLGAQGPAVVPEAPGQGIRDHPPRDVAEDPGHRALRGQDAGLPVLQTTELEEEQVVAHNRPRNGAKYSLHNHDAESGDAEEVEDRFEL